MSKSLSLKEKYDHLAEEYKQQESVINALNLEVRLINMFLYEMYPAQFKSIGVQEDNCQRCVAVRARKKALEQQGTPEIIT